MYTRWYLNFRYLDDEIGNLVKFLKNFWCEGVNSSMLFSAQWCQCLQVNLKTSLPLRNCLKMSQSRRQADTSSVVTKNRTVARTLSIAQNQPLKVMFLFGETASVTLTWWISFLAGPATIA